MTVKFIASRNGKRLIKATVPEPAYVWISVSLLAQGDSVVVNQQEVNVQSIAHLNETWNIRVGALGARPKGTEETYLSHQFLYTKATDSVKARLKPTFRSSLTGI